MKANNKELDSKEVFIEISNSMLLDNIVNEKFNTKKFQEGVDFISRYCGMIVGLLNVGLSEEQVKEIIIDIKNLAGEVEFKLGQEGVKPAHAEGMAGNSWILLDYTTVIVHVFTKEARDFYNLERLWADAEAVEFKATED